MDHLDPSQDSSPTNRKSCKSAWDIKYQHIICEQARKVLANSECLRNETTYIKIENIEDFRNELKQRTSYVIADKEPSI